MKNLYQDIELNDESLLNIFFKNGVVNKIMVQKKWLEARPHIKKYLETRYNDNPITQFSYSEVLYRMKNHIEKRPVCINCGKPVRYIKNGKYALVCSMHCFNSCPELTKKRKEGWEKSFPEGHPARNKKVQEKRKTTALKHRPNDPYNHKQLEKTMLNRYGVSCAFQIPEIQEEIKKKNIENYGVEYIFQNKEKREQGQKTIKRLYGGLGFGSERIKAKYKEKMLKLYNVDWSFKSKEIWNKIYNTWNQHYSDKTLDPQHIRPSKYPPFDSKLEKNIYETILLKLFDKDDIIIHYKDETKYPYFCDFYIKSLDLYIEIQGYFTHGSHPFNLTDEDDLKKLQKLVDKKQKEIIYCWTISDVEKRRVALKNNLNFLEIYSKNLSKIETIIKAYIAEKGLN